MHAFKCIFLISVLFSIAFELNDLWKERTKIHV